MILDLTLDFKIHVQNVYITVNKTILLLCKFHSNLPRTSLITIYKSFIRRHLNYGEINSNQAYSNSFQKKWNQFNKMDQIFNGSGGSFQIQELGLESIQNRSWYRKFCQLPKLVKDLTPRYLISIILSQYSRRYMLETQITITQFSTHEFFKHSYFPSTINEWNKLDPNIRNSENSEIFKNIFRFI